MSCLFQLDHYQIESVLVAQNEEFDSSADTHTGDGSPYLSVAAS
jgi:hypothetical protein